MENNAVAAPAFDKNSLLEKCVMTFSVLGGNEMYAPNRLTASEYCRELRAAPKKPKMPDPLELSA